jgi:hypothetical protein
MSRKKMQQQLFDAARERELEEAIARKRQGGGAAPPPAPGNDEDQGDGRGLLPFVVQAVPDAADQTGRAGLTIVAEALRGFRVDDSVGRPVQTKERQRGFREYDVVESVVMLLAAGGDHMEDMEFLREDAGLCRMMGRGFPSADVVRDFLVASHDEELMQRAFAALPSWVTERKFRGDSACYEEAVLTWLAATDRAGGPVGRIEFTVSADMTKELRAECKKVREPSAPGAPDRPRWAMLDDTRADETVEWAEVEFTPGNWPKTAAPLRYVALRFHGLQGRLYDDDQPIKYLAVVTNSTDRGDQVVPWHWGKAGTIEHVHDETRNGLGAGTLPCGEFGANAACASWSSTRGRP